jgi:hypothetical protein
MHETGLEGSAVDHIRLRWNDPRSSLSPAAFHGIEPTDRVDAGGFRVYRWRADAIPTS